MKRVQLEERPYTEGDVEKLEVDARYTVQGVKGLTKVFDVMAKYGPSMTVYLDGKPLLCAGLFMPWKGYCEAWLVADKEVKKHPVEALLMLRRTLEREIKNRKLVRVQANTSVDWPESRRFAERLGFRYEGRMRKAGVMGEDRNLLARVE